MDSEMKEGKLVISMSPIEAKLLTDVVWPGFRQCEEKANKVVKENRKLAQTWMDSAHVGNLLFDIIT